MMAFFNFKKSLAGPGYVILNTIRVLNIICLLAVIAASLVMLVKTFIVSKFFFFDAVSHVITASLGTFLIISELPFFRGYYGRNWPLLSLSSGFVTLGSLMIIVGVSILGNLNKEATSQQSLGLPFWRIVISSGIITITFGVVNIFASYIFRNRSLGVTARMTRAYGAVAPQKVDDVLRAQSKHAQPRRRSFHLNRSDELPSYNTSPKSQMATSSPTAPRSGGLNISGPMSVDQSQFNRLPENEEMKKPDLAHHPALYGGRL